jgi:hypothetical protein
MLSRRGTVRPKSRLESRGAQGRVRPLNQLNKSFDTRPGRRLKGGGHSNVLHGLEDRTLAFLTRRQQPLQGHIA